MSQDHDHWAANAADWIAWARTPDHDAFWAYRSAFGAFVGPGRATALDIGAGEGRQSRLLCELGYEVTACDPAAPLLAAARESASAHYYIAAPAAALPLPDAAYDLVLAYNVLMDLDDPATALEEMARVLAPEGRLLLSIVHPLADHLQKPGATGTDNDPPLPTDGYFGRHPFEGQETRDGLKMNFRGWSMPLSGYTTLLSKAGFVITCLEEPRPDPQSPWAKVSTWSRIPLFLWIEARKSPYPRTGL